jgi:hypothetical protein
MATVKAFLRGVNGKGLAPINVKYTHKESWSPVPTGLSIEPQYFDKESGIILETYPMHEQANAIIKQVKNHLMGVSNSMVANSVEPTDKMVVSHYRMVYGGLNKPEKSKKSRAKKVSAPKKETSLGDVNENFELLQVSETLGTYDDVQKFDELELIMPNGYDGGKINVHQINPSKVLETMLPDIKNETVRFHYINFKLNADKWLEYSKQNAKGTVAQRKTWLNTILRFSKQTNIPLDFSGFDENFYQAYGNWLMYGTHNGLKVSTLNNMYNSTFGSHVKKLKGFLTHSKKYLKKTPNPLFEDYKVLEDEKDVIFLDANEINMLWNFRNEQDIRVTINNKPMRIMVKNKPIDVKKYIEYCVFGCLTGLRWSDITRSAWVLEDLRRNNELTGKCQKNEGWYSIPLESDDRIGEILKANQYKMNKISEYDFNTGIKLILQAFYQYHRDTFPETQEKIPYFKYKFRQEFKFYEYKWNLYSSHCNRRSAITNWYFNEEIQLGEREILSMLGSRSSIELKRYISKDTRMIKNKFKKYREQKSLN